MSKRLPRQNGIASRQAILGKALDVAATRGPQAATIGTLAAALGMSKSGVFAHFGSKDALETAVIEAAADQFGRAVVTPAEAAPAGLARLAALCEGFLTYVTEQGGGRLTPDHPALGGVVQTAASARLTAWRDHWHRALEAAAADAVARGEMVERARPLQVAFEANALLEAAGRAAGRQPSDEVTRLTRAALDRVLAWPVA